LPRLFISHSSVDNVPALAFQHWLMANGWSEEDVFIDLKGIGAGERWRDTLRKANTTCEAVILLASPDALDSKECQREINLAEDLGKEIIVAILRDLRVDDPRLARYADRQFVDLSAEPRERMEPFEHDGRIQRIDFHLPALAAIKARLAHLGIAPNTFTWVPKAGGPYPGLAAFDEGDAGIFFGRDADVMTGVTKLRVLRKRRAPRALVIVAASGAGKSSFLRAGLWPRLSRDPDFAALAILRPARGILTGPGGLGRKLAPWFEQRGRVKLTGDIHAAIAGPQADTALAALLAEATELAATAQRAGARDTRAPAPVVAIDQGEEMFASENAAESDRFLELLAAVLKQPPPEVDPYILVTIRADSVEALLKRWPALGLETPESHYLAPLSPSAYRDVIVKPAEVYSQLVRRLTIEPALVDALVRDASGADALPLLAFTLEKLFHEFAAAGNLTLQRYEAMGGVGGSIDRALADAQNKAGAAGTPANLRRLIVPALATWDPSAGAAKRLVAPETALVGDERGTLTPLANALVEARLLTRGRDTLEVAHEALLRRAPIAQWLEEQKDALKLRDDVLREAKEWEGVGREAKDLVRRGERLEAARALLANLDFASVLAPAKDYLAACHKSERTAHNRSLRARLAIYVLLIGVIVGLVGWMNQATLKDQLNWYITMRPYMLSNFQPYVLTAEKERALKPQDTFRECAKDCPEMVVVPAGSFKMGSPETEAGRFDNEGPQQGIRIARPFAVAKFDVTFAEWDACVSVGGCPQVSDSATGRGMKPVINVTWDEAKQYAAWLARMTGQPYRLLSEAEWEYAARGGSTTTYFWGDDIGKGNANCNGCGSQWDARETSPVGSFKPNSFGLYDMLGNLFQWVEDCYNEGSLQGIATDGSPRTTGDCSQRASRGGSWTDLPVFLRAAYRGRDSASGRVANLGFRVARTLNP
jgi:formylglycine-generating enzyme required for sulfatase activity